MTLIQTLINGLLSDDTLLAPVVVSDKGQLGFQVLVEMLSSMPEGPLLDFLNNTVQYKVDIMANIVDGQIVPNNTLSLGGYDVRGQGIEAGVYQFQYLSDTYVGSSGNMHTRLHQHIVYLQQLSAPHGPHLKLLEACNGAWQSISWGPIYVTPNYTDMAMKAMPDYTFTVGELDILRTLTQFVPRLLEQSLISTFNPTINDLSSLVSFEPHTWNPELLNKAVVKVSSYPVTIMNTAREVIQEFPSIASAGHVISYSARTLQGWIAAGKPVFVATLGMSVLFAILSEGHRHGNKILPLTPMKFPPLTLAGGPLSDLVAGAFWAFEVDKRSFHGPFTSFVDLLKFLDPVKFGPMPGGKIRTFFGPYILALNRDTLVSSPKGQFYIACNPMKPPLMLKPQATLPTHPYTGK